MPELPETKRLRFCAQYGIPDYDAGVLTTSRAIADFFEQTVSLGANAKAASNWIMGDLLRDLKEFNREIQTSPVKPEAIADLIQKDVIGAPFAIQGDEHNRTVLRPSGAHSTMVLVFELRPFRLEHRKNLERLQRDQIVFAPIGSPFFWFFNAQVHFRIHHRELLVG
jgi:hypothetical protein